MRQLCQHYTSHELNADNKVTTSTSIHTFQYECMTMNKYVCHITHVLLYYYCSVNINPHSCIYKLVNNKMPLSFTIVFQYMCLHQLCPKMQHIGQRPKLLHINLWWSHANIYTIWNFPINDVGRITVHVWHQMMTVPTMTVNTTTMPQLTCISQVAY